MIVGDLKMKYYAVKSGKKTGIFTTWAEAEKQVKGVKGAKFKSFLTKAEAENYLNDNSCVDLSNSKDISSELTGDYAFVDGSFNSVTNTYGFGGFLLANGERYPIQGSGNDSEMATMRNVAGEILGALAAATRASELGLKQLTILYDYKGIEEWVTGGWKCNKTHTAKYKEQMQELINQGLSIKFVKVAAHTGIEGNELADTLAKQAVGLI